MNTHEKTIKVSLLVLTDVGGKRMPFSSFLPWAEGDLSPSTEPCICCAITRAGIKVSVCLTVGPHHLPCCFLLPSAVSETLLCSTCVRLCLSSGWQLHQGPAEWIAHAGCRAKEGVQKVGNKTGSMSCASLGCHSARHAWGTTLHCTKQLCQVVSRTALRN